MTFDFPSLMFFSPGQYLGCTLSWFQREGGQKINVSPFVFLWTSLSLSLSLFLSIRPQLQALLVSAFQNLNGDSRVFMILLVRRLVLHSTKIPINAVEWHFLCTEHTVSRWVYIYCFCVSQCTCVLTFYFPFYASNLKIEDNWGFIKADASDLFK